MKDKEEPGEKAEKAEKKAARPPKVKVNLPGWYVRDYRGLDPYVHREGDVLEGTKITPYVVMTVLGQVEGEDHQGRKVRVAELIEGEFLPDVVVAAKAMAKQTGIPIEA